MEAPDWAAQLEARTRELAQAADQQAATSEVLRAISNSRSDPGPVLKAVAEHAARLCDADISQIFQIDGELLRVVASHGPIPSRLRGEALRITRGSVTGRAVIDRRTIHVHDLSAELDTEFPDAKPHAGLWRHRTTVATPLLREGAPIGAIFIRRTEVRPFSDRQIALLETFADQAAIAIEQVRLFKEIEARNHDLTVALEQQTATSEVLKAISRTTFDLDAVLRVLIENATRLAGATRGFMFRYDGEVARMAVSHNAPRAYEELIQSNPIPRGHGTLVGRTLLECRPVHIPDVLADKEYAWHEAQRLGGFRSMLGVPMMREGNPIGVIAMWSDEVKPFTEKQIELVSTFADQAVIAIENVRLFNETREALERQTATAEILRVISSSPTDIQPVFDAILENAMRLCDAHMGLLGLYDGEKYQTVAHRGADADYAKWVISRGPFEPPASTGLGRMIAERQPIHIPDLREGPGYRNREAMSVKMVELGGVRTYVAVPMLKEGRVVGGITIYRPEVRPFTQKQIDLLSTFADQAVIAIENVRLFNEINEALHQQTATAEILRVISSSPTDTQPVFDAIARSGVRLFGTSVVLRLVKGDRMERVAELSPGLSQTKQGESTLLDGRSFSGRAITRRQVIHMPDIAAEAWVGEETRKLAASRGYRSGVFAPMLRENEAVGTIGLLRQAIGPFSDKQIALLKTFADQAVIAIENVRLFKELEARNRDLTESLEQQTATAEILRIISGSLTDTQPVFDAIVRNCGNLFEGNRVSLWLISEDRLHCRASTGEAGGNMPIDRGSAIGVCVLDRHMVHLPDLEKVAAQYPRIRQLALKFGYRSGIFAPLLREGRAIGGIAVLRRVAEAFGDKEVALLNTFADQAVIAIENVRLFKEIQEKSHQLEIANRHKSEFLASMSHELRTPLNAIIGFSEVLQERMFGEMNEKQEEYINDIHGSGQHLLSLINDILDLSKVEAGRMELDLATFNVPEAIGNAFTLIKERAGRHNIDLQAALDPAIGEIKADERKFKQILLNLLSNAVKFTPESGRITVAARPVDSMIEVSVTDTGIGIAPDECEAVFEEFRQVGTDYTTKAEGTGLGLALTRKFVELHGGKIWVTSEVGKGSTFIFTLPVEAARTVAAATH